MVFGCRANRVRYHNTMRFAHRFFAVLLAGTFLVRGLYADELPELGDVASTELSPATEKRVGQQIMTEIRWREPSYLDDPDIEFYLNQLGGRLVAASNEPSMEFHFFAINDNSVNAFAMFGGYIGVHTGLILTAQSESELAGVLAHEISHVTQRHLARQQFQSKRVSMASLLAMGLSLLAVRSNPQAAGAAITTTQAGAISAQLAFSRGFERESDRLGFEMLSKAGYDVHGMSGFFERLQQSTRLYENNATVYLRTHPLTGERISDMQNREEGLPYRQVADSPEFQLVRARVRARQGRPADAVKDFETLLRERKYTSEAATRYGLAVALARKGDWPGVDRELQTVRRLKMSSPMIDRLQAQARVAGGDADAGMALYREALQRYPLNLPLLYGYGDALIGQRKFKDALRFSDEQLQSFPQDIRFFGMRADAYGGLGKRAQRHLALAEMSLVKGQTAGAIEQLQLAQQAGDADFHEMSFIDGRLREVKRRQLEEMKERQQN